MWVERGGAKEKMFLQKNPKNSNWDLISCPHRLSFIGFTDVYTHTFMLKSQFYNT